MSCSVRLFQGRLPKIASTSAATAHQLLYAIKVKHQTHADGLVERIARSRRTAIRGIYGKHIEFEACSEGGILTISPARLTIIPNTPSFVNAFFAKKFDKFFEPLCNTLRIARFTSFFRVLFFGIYPRSVLPTR